jgi:predicted DNA-binding transcriptional regulator YafY
VDTQEEHSDFSIFVVPDDNLIMDFCKRGGRIEVISPEEVRQRVIDEIQNASSRYGINTK